MSHIYPVRQGLAKLVRYEKDVDTQIVTAYPTINIPLTGTGVKAILFDEFHNSLPLVNMLQYLDGYPLELPCRYANKQACYTEVYLVSNLPLERQYRALQDEKPETWAAFLRRINTVRIFAADGSHKDYSTDDYFRECVKSEYELVDFSDDDCPF